MKFLLSELIKKFGGELYGEDIEVSSISSIDLVKDGEITFLINSKYKKELVNTLASAVIISAKDMEGINIPKIVTNNPYWYFSKVSQLFNPRKLLSCGVKLNVVIGNNSKLGKNPNIADFVAIGENVQIGENCQIHPNVVIGDNVKIGDNITIFANVTIYDNVVIGNDCIIHSGVVIGSDGFGNAQDLDKKWSRIPQIGGVLIGNNVDIGANTTIDSGTFGPTIINDHVVIDNLVQIAHNVEIGSYTGIAACVGIAGSSKIGRYCMLGGGCGITGHITIADYTVIGAATGITKSINKPDLYFSVYPFSPLKEWAKNAVHIKSLNDMFQKIKNLEQKIKTMEGDSNATK
jgi:UDP-3-O-[3-hydroxymyristoyl] glucosamine N-acyltransferase